MQDRADLASFYLDLSRNGGDVVPFLLGKSQAFLINRPEYVQHVLIQNQAAYLNISHPYKELYQDYTDTGRSFLGLGGAFHSRRNVFRDAAEELVAMTADAVHKWQYRSRQAPVNAVQEFKKLMFRIHTRLLFGVDMQGLEEEFVCASSLVEESWINQMCCTHNEGSEQPNSYSDAIHTQEKIIDRIAEVLTIKTQTEHDLNLKIAIFRTLMNSFNAPAVLLCWIILQITGLREVEARLYEENERLSDEQLTVIENVKQLVYTRQVILEALRLFPPAWLLLREASVPDQIGKCVIPAKAKIAISPYTMQRLLALWPRPDEFLPERFSGEVDLPHSYAFFPFGVGRRSCPAMQAALYEVQIVLSTILRLSRIENTSGPVAPRGLIALYPDRDVWLRFLSR